MRYVHCSFDIVDEFVPRIPKTRCKIEDDTIPRICVAPDIRHCLFAMPGAGRIIEFAKAVGMPIVIHAYYLTADKVLEDVSDKVADAEFTKEMWLLSEPTRVYRVDYEITSCLVRDGKDISGDDVKQVLCVEIKRVPFTDNLKELFCFADVECDIPFSKIAGSMDLDMARQIGKKRDEYIKHKRFVDMQRRIRAYRNAKVEDD